MTTSTRSRSRRPRSRKPMWPPRRKPQEASPRQKKPRKAQAAKQAKQAPQSQSPPLGGLCVFCIGKWEARVAHRLAQGLGRVAHLLRIAAHAELDVAAAAVVAHRRQAEDFHPGVARAYGLHRRNQLALAGFVHQEGLLAP